MKDPRNDGYILGHTDQELRRLRRQAAVYAEFTEETLRRAGLEPGMSVLDVGCGAGDVSLAAARIVGPSGAVRGIDRSGDALALAIGRAAELGLTQVRFEQADLGDPDDRIYDAVIGRFILLHCTDPAAALGTVVSRVRPGGHVAFVELDLSAADVVPPMPLFAEALGWIREVYVRKGFHMDMGSKLYAAFRACGLEPELMANVRVEAGADAYAYEYTAETVRSLLPLIEALGVATRDTVGVDTLAERIRTAALDGAHCFFYPRLVGAVARKLG